MFHIVGEVVCVIYVSESCQTVLIILMLALSVSVLSEVADYCQVCLFLRTCSQDCLEYCVNNVATF